MTARACSRFAANAFSTSTGLPARMQAIACSACRLCGVAMYTRSTAGSASIASYEP